MRKILFALLLLICLGINAQIQRTFFGLELCKATKQQLKEVLQSKGIHPNDYDDVNVTTNEITFGGVTWDHSVFKFDEGILYSIVFGKKVTSLNETKVEKDVKNIEDILREKYSQYLMVDKDGHLIFCDIKTMVSSSYTDVNSLTKAYGLIYSDFATLTKLSQKQKDDF